MPHASPSTSPAAQSPSLLQIPTGPRYTHQNIDEFVTASQARSSCSRSALSTRTTFAEFGPLARFVTRSDLNGTVRLALAGIFRPRPQTPSASQALHLTSRSNLYRLVAVHRNFHRVRSALHQAGHSRMDRLGYSPSPRYTCHCKFDPRTHNCSHSLRLDSPGYTRRHHCTAASLPNGIHRYIVGHACHNSRKPPSLLRPVDTVRPPRCSRSMCPRCRLHIHEFSASRPHKSSGRLPSPLHMDSSPERCSRAILHSYTIQRLGRRCSDNPSPTLHPQPRRNHCLAYRKFRSSVASPYSLAMSDPDRSLSPHKTHFRTAVYRRQHNCHSLRP